MARGAGAAGTRGSRRACGCATSHGAVPCAVVWPCCCTVACAATGARSVLYFDKWMGCRSCTGAGVHACCDARAPVGCSAAALAGAIGNPTPVRPLRVTKRHDQAASTPECGQCFARLPFYARPEGCLPQSARHVSLAEEAAAGPASVTRRCQLLPSSTSLCLPAAATLFASRPLVTSAFLALFA
ncbi:hypothetical protein BU14_0076s0044 [Porphyra umbilicalis]|uniref:Uncharacterized protein n=1 Tax=Porphyra umbilicalis TaxID=2786 RepID=A0A1X6PF76_PORUM|nr:hypothetical protein BU14_0076s0044 [Porphyra umbilicalis]|eukprot:OSX79488.1 hypothetical protein BU14_0076s0044 [Porphyra umbilicalis]